MLAADVVGDVRGQTPMDRMLDAVEWQELEGADEEPYPSGLPVATHCGILHLGELELRVFQLSDGQRIIAAEDMHRFFGMTTEAPE